MPQITTLGNIPLFFEYIRAFQMCQLERGFQLSKQGVSDRVILCG